jgi:hypothetical protein
MLTAARQAKPNRGTLGLKPTIALALLIRAIRVIRG